MTHIEKKVTPEGDASYWVADDNGPRLSKEFPTLGEALDAEASIPQIRVTIETLSDGKTYETTGYLHAGDLLWIERFSYMLSALRGSVHIEPPAFKSVAKD